MGHLQTRASRGTSRGGSGSATKIIEAKGTIVLDENFRTGRRARKMHGEGDRKTKLRKRDRKSTHLVELPVHPALKGAYAILMGLEGGEGAGV